MPSSGFYPHRDWNENESRFLSERERFDFETLTFRVDSDNGGTETQSLLSSPNETSEVSSTSDFTEHLDISASQKLIAKSRYSSSESRRRRTTVIEAANIQETSGKLAFEKVQMAGRLEQLDELANAFHEKSTRLALISGESGSGKTLLAKEFQIQVLRNKGLFCLGKFDSNNRADPYHAIATAMGGFIQKIRKNQEALQSLSLELESVMNQEEMNLLYELLPSFAILQTGDTTKRRNAESTKLRIKAKSKISVNDRSITDRARRIQNAFVTFLRVLCKEDRSLVLCLDDIQWCGSACLSLIDSVMTADNLENFFLIATCRSEHLDGASSLETEELGNMKSEKESILLEFLSDHNSHVRRINIESLKEKQVQSIFCQLTSLEMDDDRTKNLAAIIYKKTAGNPYFVLEFVRLMHAEDLLGFNEGILEWEWCDAEIEALEVAGNVAEAVKNRLGRIDSDTIFVAQVASCISKTVDPAMLSFVIAGIKAEFEATWIDILWPKDVGIRLRTLEQMGVLESYSSGQRFEFAHDQIQQAAYQMIPQGRLALMKLNIGKRLISGMDDSHQEQVLFTAVELIASSISSLQKHEKHGFSFWAFVAGDAALQQGAFESALSFFQIAIECIGVEPFDSDMGLALPLFSGATEAAFCLSKCDEALEYVELVRAQDKIPEVKKIRVCIIEMKVYHVLAQRKLGIRAYYNFVNSMGIFRFRTEKPGVSTVLYHVLKTTSTLKKYSASQFLALPVCDDGAFAATINAFAENIPTLFIGGQNLFVVATCKCMRYIVKYGVTPNAPIVFACFGMIVSGFGDKTRALEIGEVAFELCQMHGYTESLPFSIQLIFSFVRPWLKPLTDFESPIRQTLDTAIKNGQLTLIMSIFYIYVALYIQTQRGTLQDIIKEYEAFIPKYKGFKGGTGGIDINIQFAYKLAFPDTENTSLNGGVMQEDQTLKWAKENNEDFVPYLMDYFKLQLLMHLGDPVEAAEYTKLAAAFGVSAFPGAHYAMRGTFVAGVANAMAYQKTGKAKYLKTFKTMQKRMVGWQKAKNPNVSHFIHFLDAEHARLQQKSAKAKQSYSEALSQTRRLGFRFDAAFVSERLCSFHMEGKEMDQAREYLLESIRLYEEYGARTKVLQLKADYRTFLKS